MYYILQKFQGHVDPKVACANNFPIERNEGIQEIPRK